MVSGFKGFEAFGIGLKYKASGLRLRNNEKSKQLY